MKLILPCTKHNNERVTPLPTSPPEIVVEEMIRTAQVRKQKHELGIRRKERFSTGFKKTLPGKMETINSHTISVMNRSTLDSPIQGLD